MADINDIEAEGLDQYLGIDNDVDCCTDTRNNLVSILQGKCHLCNSNLEEHNIDGGIIIKSKRVICLNCKASADSHSFGMAYVLFSEIMGF